VRCPAFDEAIDSYYFIPYYRNVRYLRLISLALLLPLALASACDRGARPAKRASLPRISPLTTAPPPFTWPTIGSRGAAQLLGYLVSPCVEEVPSLLDLHHSRPDLVIVAVSIDQDADAYANFLRRRHMDLITVRTLTRMPPGSTTPRRGRRPTSSTARA